MSRLIELLRKKYKGNLHRIASRLVFLSEALAVVLAIIISIDSVFYYSHTPIHFSYQFVVFGFMVFLSRLALSQLSTISILPRTQRRRTLLFRFLQVSFFELIICTVIWILIGVGTIPYVLVPLYCIISFILTVIIRLISYRFFKHYRAKGYNTRYVIIIADSFSDATIEQLLKQKEWGFNIKYILSNSKLIKAKFGHQIKIFREDADLKFLIDCDVIDEVLYCKNKISDGQLKGLIKTCEEVGVLFRMQSNMSPLKPVKLQLQTVHMKPYFQLVDTPALHLGVILKYLSDIYFSSLALILFSPLLLLIAIVIKLSSKGPVFYIQERIGLRGRRFNLYKFRTMVQNAESVQHILDKQNEADGPAFKIKYDPRITKFGRFLRKTGLDELPQLLNVVKGEMSLIGPRPPVAKEVVQYERWQLRRLSVKPGITCSWQVLENRNDVSFEKWMKLDLQYIDNWSLLGDAKLFLRTFNAVIKATGY
ncbi:hypothetical protein ES705_08956 [subsurface metagenome]